MVTDRGDAEIALLQKLWYSETAGNTITEAKEPKKDPL